MIPDKYEEDVADEGPLRRPADSLSCSADPLYRLASLLITTVLPSLGQLGSREWRVNISSVCRSSLCCHRWPLVHWVPSKGGDHMALGASLSLNWAPVSMPAGWNRPTVYRTGRGAQAPGPRDGGVALASQAAYLRSSVQLLADCGLSWKVKVRLTGNIENNSENHLLPELSEPFEDIFYCLEVLL